MSLICALRLNTSQNRSFADTSFGRNSDLTLRLEYVNVIPDAGKNANGFHYSSRKSKIVARNVLEAEIFAAVRAFDYVSALRATLNNVRG